MSARRARAARGVLATTLAAIAAMGGAAAEQPSGAALAIRAARVFTATGLPPIADGVVIVRAGRIVAVGPRASVPIPVEATVVELPNHTVLPGLIDTHSHFLNRYAAGGVLGLEAQRAAPPNVQMVSVVRNARVQFLSGVTTVRQTGEPNYNDILMRDAIAAGTLVGPRVVASGPLITSTGGHGAGEHGLDGEDAFRRAVRERVKRGAEWIKLTQLDVSPDAAQISPTEIRAAIDEAHRLGVKVTVHATGRWGSAIRTAVEAGADNIEHARPLTPALLALMLKRGTTASLTPIVYIGWRPTPRTWQVMDAGVSNAEEWINYMAKEIADYRAAHPANENDNRPYEDNEPGRAARDMFEGVRNVQRAYVTAWKAGLRFSMGSDGFPGTLPLAVEFLVEAGIPHGPAIEAATRVAADLIGYGDRLGTLESGKVADLIAVEGNPLADVTHLRRVRFVMRDGERFDRLSWR